MSDAFAMAYPVYGPAMSDAGTVAHCQTPNARDARWSCMMVAAQAGDARAYNTLLRECVPLLRAICRRRLRVEADVEDAVQDALLTIHRVRHTYDPARPLGPWLVAIADRRALDHGRSLGRAARGQVDLDAASDVASSGPDADGEMDSRRASAMLVRAIEDLPLAQRTALSLTKIHDLSLAEASSRSGMTVGALKVATHRALGTLRRRFGVKD